MHLCAQIDTLLYQSDFLLILVVTLVHDDLDERHRRFFLLGCRLHAQQFPQPYLVVAPVRRQEMNRLSFLSGFVDAVLQLAHREGLGNTCCLRLLLQRGLSARPYDVIYCQFIAEHHCGVGINVDDSSQTGIVEAEVIKESTVLTETISVVSIVHAHLVIAEEEQQPATHVLAESRPAADICLLTYFHTCFLVVIIFRTKIVLFIDRDRTTPRKL